VSGVATAMLAGAAYIELRALGNNLNQDVQEKAQEAGKSFSSRFSTAAKLGLATVGGVAAEAFGKALENANTQNILKAQLGLSDADSKRLGSISGELYAKAYGDSLDEINDALKSLMQSGVTNLNQPREEIQGITADALNLSKAFGVDVAESANAAGQMIKTGMAKNGKEAFDILTIAFQKFGQNGDDVLDTLGEYNVQFQRLGIDGPMAMGLINQGLKAGARNTDFIADGIKEFTINATQGSTKIAQGWKDLGLNSDVMFKKIGAGGKTATDAFGETLAKLRDIKDPIKQGAIATELFGTKAEDLGKALFALDPSTAVQSLGKVTGAADTLGNTLRDNSQVEIEEFKRRAEMFMTGKMAELIPFVTGVGSAFASLPAPLQLGVASFGGLVLAAGPVSKVMSGVKSATTGIASVATGAYSGVMNLAAGFNSSEAAASSFTGRMGTIGGAIRSGAGSVGSALSTMGSAALNVASNAGTAALNVAKSTGSMALNAATSAGQFALQMGRMSAAAVTNMATVAWQFT
jgi:phage-related minor tail protein